MKKIHISKNYPDLTQSKHKSYANKTVEYISSPRYEKPHDEKLMIKQ